MNVCLGLFCWLWGWQGSRTIYPMAWVWNLFSLIIFRTKNIYLALRKRKRILSASSNVVDTHFIISLTLGHYCLFSLESSLPLLPLIYSSPPPNLIHGSCEWKDCNWTEVCNSKKTARKKRRTIFHVRFFFFSVVQFAETLILCCFFSIHTTSSFLSSTVSSIMGELVKRVRIPSCHIDNGRFPSYFMRTQGPHRAAQPHRSHGQRQRRQPKWISFSINFHIKEPSLFTYKVEWAKIVQNANHAIRDRLMALYSDIITCNLVVVFMCVLVCITQSYFFHLILFTWLSCVISTMLQAFVVRLFYFMFYANKAVGIADRGRPTRAIT